MRSLTFSNPIRCSIHSYRRYRLRNTSLEQQVHTFIQKATIFDNLSNDSAQVRFGQQLKDDFKQRRKEKRSAAKPEMFDKEASRLARWELTVGLEIHAQLNTERKLFSQSRASVDETPNMNTSVFDLAFPGSQPSFQVATLIPALRAAVALGCKIRNESRFDRKHYFYADQPAGYQITQFYKPFAVDGSITLFDQDGIDPAYANLIIGIKQVQMEQDTAKSIQQPPSSTLVDFNRAGHSLIEIITLPDIHSAHAAAACARKIQAVLQAVNAIDTGMEMGGLRVDVNVSISPKGSPILGQRTEIKNLSSFKAVELAIIAERDRQIEVLEQGGAVAGETRGWSIGDTHTTKLRGKEGEVDYRYMPDPDILPLLIDNNLVEHIQATLPSLPDDAASQLVNDCGLTSKDARTLVALDDGQRLDYFDDVCDEMSLRSNDGADLPKETSRMVGNWVIHELGGHLSAGAAPFSSNLVPAASLATILVRLHDNQITGTSAKRLLAIVFEEKDKNVDSLIDAHDMKIQPLSEEEYRSMARDVMEKHPDMVDKIRRGQIGKMKFLIGQMMRMGQSNIVALNAEAALNAEMALSEDEKGNNK